MTRQHIHMGIEPSNKGFEHFIDAWKQAEQGKNIDTEVHLNFEDLAMLIAIITPKRLEILKKLRQQGPMSVRALAATLARNYKNVHVDTRALEDAGLLERTETGALQAPWDVIDAHLSLVA